MLNNNTEITSNTIGKPHNDIISCIATKVPEPSGTNRWLIVIATTGVEPSAPSLPAPAASSTKSRFNKVVMNRPTMPKHHRHLHNCNWLNRYIDQLTSIYLKSPGYKTFITLAQGQGNIAPDVAKLNHLAALLLAHFGTIGAPAVVSTKPWSKGRIKKGDLIEGVPPINKIRHRVFNRGVC